MEWDPVPTEVLNRMNPPAEPDWYEVITPAGQLKVGGWKLKDLYIVNQLLAAAGLVVGGLIAAGWKLSSGIAYIVLFFAGRWVITIVIGAYVERSPRAPAELWRLATCPAL